MSDYLTRKTIMFLDEALDNLEGLLDCCLEQAEAEPESTRLLMSALEPFFASCRDLHESLAQLVTEQEPRDSEWREFLEAHAELQDLGKDLAQPVQVKDAGRPFDDDELLAALAQAIDERRGKPGQAGSAWASDVAKCIYGDLPGPLHSYERRARVGRCAARLGKLAAQGDRGVVRLRRRYVDGTCLWSLKGVRLSKRLRLDYEVSGSV